jgi:TPR repeat protein
MERKKTKKKNSNNRVNSNTMKPHLSAFILYVLGTPAVWADQALPLATQELQAAAQRGEAEAQFNLARAYLHGTGVPKAPEKAFTLMQAAAAQGHADALGGVGYFFSVGLTVDADPKQAADWFRKGAEKGSAKAQLNLGKYLLDEKAGGSGDLNQDQMREQGLQWIKKAADQGLPEAGVSYGRILYLGDHGHPQDYKQAFVYLEPAARFGLAEAQNILGSIYQNGSGTPIDDVAAEQWYRKAALQGHLRAQSNLGMLLGPLVENKKTRIEALAWLLMASEKEQITAKKALADAEPALKAGDLDEAKKKKLELAKLVKK